MNSDALKRLEALGIKPRMTFEHLESITLDGGGHGNAKDGHCLLEVVSMFAGERFSDSPVCVDPVLAAFGRAWNDGLPDEDRQALKRYIPMLPGTAQGEALSVKRSWMAVDWLIRTYVPTWLGLVQALAEHAAALRALAPITEGQGLATASLALDQARAAAGAAGAAARAAAGAAARAAAGDAAWDAAGAAAWAAAGDAAGAAARAAAGAAAGAAARAAAGAAAGDAARAAARAAAVAAAWDAAGAAAWDAAGAAAWAAAWDAVEAAMGPSKQALQASAHDLYLSMINAELRELGADGVKQ